VDGRVGFVRAAAVRFHFRRLTYRLGAEPSLREGSRVNRR
jgi:hypothetical protein